MILARDTPNFWLQASFNNQGDSVVPGSLLACVMKIYLIISSLKINLIRDRYYYIMLEDPREIISRVTWNNI